MKRSVLITGASSGFGFLSAILFAERGYQVFATVRSPAKGKKLADEIASRKLDIQILYMDVTYRPEVTSAYESVERQCGKLDVLINNAGYGIGGFFEDLTEKEIRDQFETNFFGAQTMVREFLPLIKKSSKGRIINISSVGGRRSVPGLGAYSASKFALEGFSESLRLELLSTGIYVVLIEPGSFETEIFSSNLKMGERSLDPKGPNFSFTNAIHKAVTRGKLAKMRDKNPGKVAELIFKAAEIINPNLRYMIGTDAFFQVMIPKILGWRIYEWLFRKQMSKRPK